MNNNYWFLYIIYIYRYRLNFLVFISRFCYNNLYDGYLFYFCDIFYFFTFKRTECGRFKLG